MILAPQTFDASSHITCYNNAQQATGLHAPFSGSSLLTLGPTLTHHCSPLARHWPVAAHPSPTTGPSLPTLGSPLAHPWRVCHKPTISPSLVYHCCISRCGSFPVGRFSIAPRVTSTCTWCMMSATTSQRCGSRVEELELCTLYEIFMLAAGCSHDFA